MSDEQIEKLKRENIGFQIAQIFQDIPSICSYDCGRKILTEYVDQVITAKKEWDEGYECWLRKYHPKKFCTILLKFYEEFPEWRG